VYRRLASSADVPYHQVLRLHTESSESTSSTLTSLLAIRDVRDTQVEHSPRQQTSSLSKVEAMSG
jgi:hypothetical protein